MTMPRNRLVATILAVLLVPAAALANETSCPAARSGRPLSSVSVFDGPPCEQADLVPGSIRSAKGGRVSTWQVAPVVKGGRGVYVQCRYGEDGPLIVLEPKRPTICVFTTTKDRGNAFRCR